MYVKNVDMNTIISNHRNNEKKDYITYKSTKCMTLEQYAKWLIKINQNSILPSIN
jgi:hypothetical protein